jgi:hypothetical protein
MNSDFDLADAVSKEIAKIIEPYKAAVNAQLAEYKTKVNAIEKCAFANLDIGTLAGIIILNKQLPDSIKLQILAVLKGPNFDAYR